MISLSAVFPQHFDPMRASDPVVPAARPSLKAQVGPTVCTMSPTESYGGAKGDRTPDLLAASQALSQLSSSARTAIYLR